MNRGVLLGDEFIDRNMNGRFQGKKSGLNRGVVLGDEFIVKNINGWFKKSFKRRVIRGQGLYMDI